jgi:hypothetical protein
MTMDINSLLLHHRVEFLEDAALIMPKRPFKPPLPVRHVADHVGRLYPYGRSLGSPFTPVEAQECLLRSTI